MRYYIAHAMYILCAVDKLHAMRTKVDLKVAIICIIQSGPTQNIIFKCEIKFVIAPRRGPGQYFLQE